MAKEGFNNQWIEICRIGEFVEAGGKRVVIDEAFLKQAIANFNAGHHEPPVVVGHPELDAPAFGWTHELRQNGNQLEARFSDTNDDFEELVKTGAFKKRSSAFYLHPPTLKHVGFLGAMPPAVKGLKNIHFAEGEVIAFENTFNLNEENSMNEKNENTAEDKKTFGEWMKEFFGGAAQPAPAAANFSEADKQQLIETAVAQATDAATAKFAEELKSRDETIQSLRDDVNNQSASGKRSQIVAFCERQGNGKITPAMKRAGIVEFMESLEVADAKETDKAIVRFSDGAEGEKTEVKFSRREWFENFVESLPPFVQFGEKFGALTVSGDATVEMVNPGEVSKLRESMGVKAETGGEK